MFPPCRTPFTASVDDPLVQQNIFLLDDPVHVVMSEEVVFELAPLSVQFFVNLQSRIAEFDADGFSVQDGDLFHKLAGDGVIVYRKFRSYRAA